MLSNCPIIGATITISGHMPKYFCSLCPFGEVYVRWYGKHQNLNWAAKIPGWVMNSIVAKTCVRAKKPFRLTHRKLS